jgi:murein DD-endopeptidase MepM/ murein hydrolase activator NlpD
MPGPPAPSALVGMVFPVCGKVTWSDTFGQPRSGGRTHAGQDIMAPKMRPVVAAFDGVVWLGRPARPNGHWSLTLRGDNGWTANYMHLNNDTPGTDDGQGTDELAFAPGLTSGTHVRAGQLLGYVGDSGNAEDTAPHLHFELRPTTGGGPVNAAPYLKAAVRLDKPRTFDAGTEPPAPGP